MAEHPKRELETRPLKAFFLKTFRMTLSENFRIYLLLRNNCFWRERKKNPINRIFAKPKNVVFSLFIITKKLSIGAVWKNVYGFVSSLCFRTILKIWTQLVRLGFEKFSVEIVLFTTSMEKSIAHASPFGENPAGEIARALCFPILGLPLICSASRHLSS